MTSGEFVAASVKSELVFVPSHPHWSGVDEGGSGAGATGSWPGCWEHLEPEQGIGCLGPGAEASCFTIEEPAVT